MQKEADRYAELLSVFQGVPEGDVAVIRPLIKEVAYLETEMDRLRKMPHVVVHPKHPEIQKTTPAAREYKTCSQSYMNAIRILLGVLRKADAAAEDELLKRLEEFM